MLEFHRIFTSWHSVLIFFNHLKMYKCSYLKGDTKQIGLRLAVCIICWPLYVEGSIHTTHLEVSFFFSKAICSNSTSLGFRLGSCWYWGIFLEQTLQFSVEKQFICSVVMISSIPSGLFFFFFERLMLNFIDWILWVNVNRKYCPFVHFHWSYHAFDTRMH